MKFIQNYNLFIFRGGTFNGTEKPEVCCDFKQ